MLHTGQVLSTADAVTKWVQEHPFLHTDEAGPGTPPGVSPHLISIDANAQLALLKPMLEAVGEQQ